MSESKKTPPPPRPRPDVEQVFKRIEESQSSPRPPLKESGTDGSSN
jgi:hypothetical protein